MTIPDAAASTPFSARPKIPGEFVLGRLDMINDAHVAAQHNEARDPPRLPTQTGAPLSPCLIGKLRLEDVAQAFGCESRKTEHKHYFAIGLGPAGFCSTPTCRALV